jgi:hypothetical protein
MNMRTSRAIWLASGIVAGIGLATFLLFPDRRVQAASNDRYEDYIMCTGAVATAPRAITDGVWLLDYRSGRLLATMIDRTVGKIIGWAEVDLVSDLGIAPRQNVHFMMTTGNVTQGQAALYVAETVSGRFAVYTMGPRPDGGPGFGIRKQDMLWFRPQPKPN